MDSCPIDAPSYLKKGYICRVIIVRVNIRRGDLFPYLARLGNDIEIT